MVLFCLVIFVGLGAGALFAFTVVPVIGEAIGNTFYQPNTPIEKNPHSAALPRWPRWPGAISKGRSRNTEKSTPKIPVTLSR
jgi:hypothetical protein